MSEDVMMTVDCNFGLQSWTAVGLQSHGVHLMLSVATLMHHVDSSNMQTVRRKPKPHYASLHIITHHSIVVCTVPSAVHWLGSPLSAVQFADKIGAVLTAPKRRQPTAGWREGKAVQLQGDGETCSPPMCHETPVVSPCATCYPHALVTVVSLPLPNHQTVQCGAFEWCKLVLLDLADPMREGSYCVCSIH